MRVWIDMDEWWPVYSLRTDNLDLDFIQDEIVEMSEGDYNRLKESLRIANANFGAVQNEIGQIYEAHKAKLKKGEQK